MGYETLAVILFLVSYCFLHYGCFKVDVTPIFQEKEDPYKTVIVSGTVYDYYTKKPLGGMHIDLGKEKPAFPMGPVTDPISSMTTDASGKFVFNLYTHDYYTSFSLACWSDSALWRDPNSTSNGGSWLSSSQSYQLYKEEPAYMFTVDTVGDLQKDFYINPFSFLTIYFNNMTEQEDVKGVLIKNAADTFFNIQDSIPLPHYEPIPGFPFPDKRAIQKDDYTKIGFGFMGEATFNFTIIIRRSKSTEYFQRNIVCPTYKISTLKIDF